MPVSKEEFERMDKEKKELREWLIRQYSEEMESLGDCGYTYRELRKIPSESISYMIASGLLEARIDRKIGKVYFRVSPKYKKS